MTTPEHTANLLGAVALALTDRTGEAVAAAAGHSETAAAALSALYHFLDGPSIDRLRQVLGLTSSGTVRLVDRLTEDGYVRRESGPDGRTTVVRLTPAGRRAARKVTAARAEVLAAALRPLSGPDREKLDELLAAILVGQMRPSGATRWLCRLCHLGDCGRSAGECPVANAAAIRYR